MAIETIYDFEGAIEPAIKTLLTDKGLACLTTRDAPTLQKAVPRVELSYTHGPGLKRFVGIDVLVAAQLAPPEVLTTNVKDAWIFRRESCWQGQLNLEIITQADVNSHAQYRSKVRSVIASCWQFINGFTITYHSILFENEGGNSPVYQPQEGYYGTKIVYPVKISVQADAWAALNT